MTLYLWTPNKELHNLLIETADSYRKTDSGFDIPMIESNIDMYNITPIINLGIRVACKTSDGKPAPCLLLPRSSLSKTPFRLANSIGLIDMGYRGEVQARVDNLMRSSDYLHITSGTRYFQLCQHSFMPWEDIIICQYENELPEALDNRGSGGFGSTG